MSFEQLGLSAELLRAVSDQGYAKPTLIQEQAIPIILKNYDVMGGAQTGTGKTASFTLPMLQKLETFANSSMSPARHPIRALILVPTRELAVQVHESVKTYGKYSVIRSTVIYGGVNIDAQIEAVRSGIEILVATPGRLLDHLQQKTLSLAKVEILILDEADRMLDMGFLPAIRQIIDLLPEKRQNLMFSATFSDEIKKLANKILVNPVLIEVAKQNSVSELITHIVHPVGSAHKHELLNFLIKQHALKQVLVFTRTKITADRVAQRLERTGISNAAIHGDRNQLQRTQALENFKQGQISVLVATDVAARGIDIEELTHVINFELPNNPEDYIHRIGRTGRAGAKGFAISLVSKEEDKLLAGVEKLLNTKISVEEISDFDSKKSPSVSAKNISYSDEKKNKRAQSGVPKRNSDSIVRISNDVFLRKSKRAEKTSDPLFTQPYVSKHMDMHMAHVGGTQTDRTLNHHSRHKQSKALPALFLSPAANKQK